MNLWAWVLILLLACLAIYPLACIVAYFGWPTRRRYEPCHPCSFWIENGFQEGFDPNCVNCQGTGKVRLEVRER